MIKKLIGLMDFNERKTLSLLVLVALVLRVIYVFSIYSVSGTSIFGDDLYYIFLGEQIASGNWVPQLEGQVTFNAGPTLPLLVAIFIKLFNDPVIPFFIYNIIVTSLMVPVLYFLGKELFNQNTGWLIAIWGVLFMEAYKYSPHILKESTLFLFVPLTLFFLVRSIKADKPFWHLLWASISFTWLIHTDERYFIYLPLFLGFFIFIKPWRFNSFIRLAGFWFFFVFLLMIPWSIRNYKTFNQFVILTPRTTAITSKFWGNNISTNAAHFTDDVARERDKENRYDQAVEFGNQYGISPRVYGQNVARIRAFMNFWQPTYFRPTFIQYGFRSQIWSLKHNLVSMVFYGIFLPFYLIGIILLIKKKHLTGFWLAMIPVIHSVMHAYLVMPLERYRSPITFIVVMIGIGAAKIFYCRGREKFITKTKSYG